MLNINGTMFGISQEESLMKHSTPPLQSEVSSIVLIFSEVPQDLAMPSGLGVGSQEIGEILK